jgi:hypothetical protein
MPGRAASARNSSTGTPPATWKDFYRSRADGLFCFAQDLFGRQFAVVGHRRVVVFEPETADTLVLGDRLEDWAAWLLAARTTAARAPSPTRGKIATRRWDMIGGASRTGCSPTTTRISPRQTR